MATDLSAAQRVPLRVVAGLFLAALALRPQLLAIGPLLPLIRADLDLSAGVAGFLTAIPVLCMGVFAPVGPLIAARFGPRVSLGGCLAVLIGFGILRSLAPSYPLVLLATLALGVGIGVAGPIPAIVVSQRIAARPALGTGAYAGGIVAGSTIGAAVAVPLAIDGDWRRSLLVVSVVSLVSIAAWLLLVRGDIAERHLEAHVPRLPWRYGTGWLLVAIFGLQSLLYYGTVSWLPNVFVEHGWSADAAGSLIAIYNGIGLFTTLGLPLVADRFGGRREQLVVASVAATVTLFGILVAPSLAYLWVSVLGLSLGAVFPLVLTLPLDVADDPGQVGSVAALMLLGGYIVSAIGPFALGAARDVSGSFQASLSMMVLVGIGLVGCCLVLSPARLRRGIRRRSC